VAVAKMLPLVVAAIYLMKEEAAMRLSEGGVAKPWV
jgi:hypothetical protein